MSYEIGGTWEENFDGIAMQSVGIVENENLVAASFDEDFDIAKDRARRIVACVNKFEGLTTDQIESMPVSVLQMSEFVDALNVSRDTYRELCEELKNRLIAARFMFAIYGINLKQLGDQINESITKADAILGEKK